MNRTRVTLVVALWLAQLAIGSMSRAEIITDEEYGFTLDLPTGWVFRPDLVEPNPDVIHAYEYDEPSDSNIAILLLIKKLGGTIGRERLTMKDMPTGWPGSLFVEQWQQNDIDAFALPEVVEGTDVITLSAQIPLRRQAIQVMVFGTADHEAALRSLLKSALSSLDGPTSWEAIESRKARLPVISNWLMPVMLVLFVGSGVFFWFVARRTPRGTVLVLGLLVYIVSWQYTDTDIRLLKIIVGLLRMLGLTATIIGFISLFWRRKRGANRQETQ